MRVASRISWVDSTDNVSYFYMSDVFFVEQRCVGYLCYIERSTPATFVFTRYVVDFGSIDRTEIIDLYVGQSKRSNNKAKVIDSTRRFWLS